MKPNQNIALIDELLTRSVDSIYPSPEVLRQKLQSGKQLRVYMGIDPTATYVHIGHATNYLILERLHALGHKIIVLVGDFTATIGDPSDKTSMRVQLTDDEVAANLKTFKRQIGKILDFDNTDNPIEFRFNSEWLGKLGFKDIVELASNFTMQQMVERDAFQKRLVDNKPLFMHEFLYPFMQGYDSVALDVDLEIGGTDQTFNMLAGRTLLKRYKNKEKCVMTTTLLVNPKTNEKLMSKSQGTGVSLDSDPDEMFGKTMALPDEGMLQCFIDCTRLSMEEVGKIRDKLDAGENPKEIKMQLAKEIVRVYHSAEAANTAADRWSNQFTNREEPENIQTFEVTKEIQSWADLIVAADLIQSKSEARRLLEQGAIRLNGVNVEQDDFRFNSGDVLKVGKRKYLKIIRRET